LIRILTVILLVASSGLLLFFSHQQLKISLIQQQDPIAAVPLDAGLIIESKKIKNTWVTLSETNLIWSKLLEFHDFHELDMKIKQLDSFFVQDKRVEEVFHNNKVIVSLHPGSESVEVFAVTNTSKEVYHSIIKLLSNKGFGNKKSNQSTVEYIDKAGKNFLVAYKEPFLMYSTSRMLIDQSLSQVEKGMGLLSNKGYSKVNSTKSTSSDFHVFLQPNQLIRIAANYLNKDVIQEWQEGAFFKGWLELDLSIKPNSLLFSGLTLLESSGLFDQSINRQKPISKKNYNMIPSKVNSIKRYAISDMSDFVKDHALIEPSTIDAKCQCNSVSLIEELVRDELILAELESRGVSQKALIFNKPDYKSSRVNLQLLGYGDSLIKVVGENKMYQLKSNLFTNLLGVKLGKDVLYYQEVGDYVVLSTIEGLRSLIKEWNKNKNNSELANFSYYSANYLTNFSSVDYFWKNNEFFNSFKGYFKNEYLGSVDQLSDVLSDIDGISFQASSSTPLYNFHSYTISTGNSTVEKSSQLWIVDIDSITRAPFLMKNHRSKTLELLAQDDNHVLHLISATGKIKWSKQIEGEIIGNVAQMDFYKNGKWQMLFNTQSKVHLLDINGEEVSGFPFTLNFPATNSVNVFDYENNGKYRFLVCAEDKKIYNFNKSGEPLSDWKHPISKDIVNSVVAHFVVNNKDYLFTYDRDGNIYLYDRRGNIRYDSKATCRPNKPENIRFKKEFDIDHSLVIYIDSLNNVVQVRFNGDIDTLNIKVPFEGQQCFMNLFEWGKDQLIYYSMSSDDKMAIYGPDNELQFIEYFDFSIGNNIQILGKNNKYIMVSNEKEQEIYLYDSDYNPTNVFSVQGTSKTVVGDMNFDGLDEVITITTDGEIIAYSINANFN